MHTIELNIYGDVIRDTCRPRPKCAREVLKHLCTADNATSPLATVLSRIKDMTTQQMAKCVLHKVFRFRSNTEKSYVLCFSHSQWWVLMGWTIYTSHRLMHPSDCHSDAWAPTRCATYFHTALHTCSVTLLAALRMCWVNRSIPAYHCQFCSYNVICKKQKI